MTTSLTDRYVAHTVRHLPERHRREIERELRAAIADDIEARTAHGEAPADAEYAALRELGDPAHLAARYVHRAMALIGPDTYPGYVHALRVACWSVLPALYVVLALVLRAHGENAWTAIFRPIGITLTVAMYLVVGVTALFAIADRQRGAHPETTEPIEPWTPDRLVTIENPRPARWSDLIVEIVLAVVLIAALFAQRVLSPVTTADGASVPIVNPGLWAFWVPYFIAVTVLALVVRAVTFRLRQWSPATAVAATALTLAGTVPLAWLFWQAQVLNHALTQDTGDLATPGSWIAWLAVLVLALVTTGSLFRAWRPRSGGGEVDSIALQVGAQR
ncbi:permease prefix domain 1-containing protein [Nonomuraea sp. NPDC049028]|uniref:permease prefix domain 1-containing protein n=1 Tax=Nonomuraea sp. NPDC049028 TaxID=3364348 RepID=UPI00371C494A